MGIYLMTSLVPSCWSAAAYYCVYWVGGAVDVGALMSLMWGGITIGVLLFIPVSKKFGKRDSAAIGLTIQAFGSIILWFAPTSVAMVWISTVFRSVGHQPTPQLEGRLETGSLGRAYAIHLHDLCLGSLR